MESEQTDEAATIRVGLLNARDHDCNDCSPDIDEAVDALDRLAAECAALRAERDLTDDEREVVVMALRDFAESEREYALDRDTPEDLAERAPVAERAALADAIADRLAPAPPGTRGGPE